MMMTAPLLPSRRQQQRSWGFAGIAVLFVGCTVYLELKSQEKADLLFHNKRPTIVPAPVPLTPQEQVLPTLSEEEVKVKYSETVEKHIKKLREKHPVCFSSDLVTKDDGNPNLKSQQDYINVAKLGRYVQRKDWQSHIPRYDHYSCKVMRSRYNCAHAARPYGYKAQFPNETEATDYTLILQSKENATTADSGVCYLTDLIDDLKGPMGLAPILKERVDAWRKAHKLPARAPETPVKLILQGNSFVRQVWEALTCTWSHAITDITLHVGGPIMSLTAMRARNYTPFETQELGILRYGLNRQPPGCHSDIFRNTKKFYAPGVAIPPQFNQCNDNVAMVEFAGMIRFYFIFHPERWENALELYDRLRLKAEDLDGIIGNGHNLLSPGAFIYRAGDAQAEDEAILAAKEVIAQQHPEVRINGQNQTASNSSAHNASSGRLLDHEPQIALPENLPNMSMLLLLPENSVYQELQWRDLHYWHGGNNPGMLIIPDDHPCMPGVPDDEVNLLLFGLLRSMALRPEH